MELNYKTEFFEKEVLKKAVKDFFDNTLDNFVFSGMDVHSWAREGVAVHLSLSGKQ